MKSLVLMKTKQNKISKTKAAKDHIQKVHLVNYTVKDATEYSKTKLF